ncbi:MAG: hypothetical protein LBE03_00305 [Candidatus Nomurabacteria bacterium]|jgi:glutathione synthase/RimK-type ligase-like ATP-grasp enzyme|nr:hypothetical protein [Candidatus Nomurabacteria bacterium]
MKTIAICLKKLPPLQYLPNTNKDGAQFRSARFELMQRLADNGFYVCTVGKEDYLGNGKFAKHLLPIDFSETKYQELGEVVADVVYDRAEAYLDDLPYLNDRKIGKVFNNKKLTFEMFGDLQPKTIFVEVGSKQNIADVAGDGGKIVVKPYDKSGGEGIIIGEVSELMEKLPDPPFLAQEFIETSGGVAGIAKGRHDVRVFLAGGKIVGGSVRQPLSGGYLSNTHQGGSMQFLTENELPNQAKKMALEVDSRLERLPRFYSADFFFSSVRNRWFLIELNGSPGLVPSDFGEVGQNLQQVLTMEILKVAKQS